MYVKVKFKIGEKKGITANYTVNNNNPIRTIFKINAAKASFYSLTGSPYDNANLKDALDLKADKSELESDMAAVDEAISDIQTVVTNNYTTLDNKIDNVNSDLSGDISTLTDTVNSNNTAVNNRIDTTNQTVANLSTTVADNNTAINTRVDGIVNSFDGDISSLETALQNEVTTRAENDTTLQNSINTLSNNLSTEINNRTAADETLQGNIDTLSETVTSNYDTLDSKIDTEISNRTAADTALQGNIDAEAAARENADTTLQSNINTITGTVASNYSTLDNKIDSLTGDLNNDISALTQTVSNNYTQLNTNINTLSDTVDTNDTAINSKVDGINTTLTNSINTLSDTVASNYTTLDNSIDKLDMDTAANFETLTGTVRQNYTDLSSAITNSASTINNRIDTEVNTLNTAITTENTQRQAADNNLQSQIDAITSASDVFDIVGTYAELQAYDIASVPTNDIIKVLVDSTHNNTATYYRCIDNDGVKSWSYIGSEGAYYTKSEADTKFVDKTTTINNKPLTNNITLDASDIGALPDDTVIGSGVITLQKNGTDIDSFNVNTTTNKSINISVPTSTSDLTNDSNFATVSQIPTNNNQLTNGANYITATALTGYATEDYVTEQGYLTGITSNDVTTALGYTPYNATNPNGYITANALDGYATEQWVTTQNYVNGATLTTTLANYVTNTSLANTLADYALISSIPTNNNQLANGAGYLTGITSNDVTTALNYTPADTTLSNVTAIDTNSAVQAALDSKVSKSGDTMTGRLSFLTNLDISNPPASGNQYFFTEFKDVNNSRVGILGSGIMANGNHGVYMQAGNEATLWVLTDGTNGWAQTSSTPPANDNSTKIATTAFVKTATDGQWVSSASTIATNVTWKTNTAAKQYSLSSYLPNDGYKYEVLFRALAITGTTSGNFVTIGLTTDIMGYVTVCEARTRTTSTMESQGSCIIPVGTGRWVRQYSSDSSNANGTYSLYACGYRRIGTNA